MTEEDKNDGNSTPPIQCGNIMPAMFRHGCSLNSPPPNGRWLRVAARSRIDRPCGRLHHLKVVVWLRGLLFLDIPLPDFIGHAAARHRMAATLIVFHPFEPSPIRRLKVRGGLPIPYRGPKRFSGVSSRPGPRVGISLPTTSSVSYYKTGEGGVLG